MKQALDSSLNGLIQQGDMVGIWTFNENVSQGLFPSQAWSQPTQLAFAVRLAVLVEPENYSKRARFEKVIPDMLKVISENENVTVVFVSSGEGLMQGAPFSAQINSAWKEWHDEQEGAHMPLLTALRTRNGQGVDWLFTPAPRSINLPALTADSQLADARENNSGVILESGLAPTKTEPAALAPEQQIAFSAWALGRTSLVNTVTNHPTAPAKGEDSALKQLTSSATPTTNAPAEQPAQIANSKTSDNDSLKAAATVTQVPQEQTNSAPVPTPGVPASETPQIPDNATAETTLAKEAPAEPIKPVQVVFVTNAAPPRPVAEPAAQPKKSLESTQPVISTTPRDPQMLAHARAAKPEEEDRAQESAAAVPGRSFVRENINPLALIFVAAFGAAYSFKRWFLSQKRISRATTSLAQEVDEEPAEEEGKKRPLRPRAAA